MFKTKGILLLVVIICFLGFFSTEAYSYQRYSSFVGKWKATVNERNEAIDVGLEFYVHGNNLEGKFEILTETGGDITEGMFFNIENVQVRGDELSFVVPLFDKDDDDSLFFQLELGWGGLSGVMREMHQGSKAIPITFNKARRGFLY